MGVGVEVAPAETATPEAMRPDQNFHVSTDKVFPADGLFSLGSRREAMPTENVAHRLIGQEET